MVHVDYTFFADDYWSVKYIRNIRSSGVVYLKCNLVQGKMDEDEGCVTKDIE